MVERALLLAAVTLIGCAGAQVTREPTDEEEARAAARLLAKGRFPDCQEMQLTPIRELSQCAAEVPVERWPTNEQGELVGDGCDARELVALPPGALWLAKGCGRIQRIHCGGCDGSMSACYLEGEIIECVTAALHSPPAPRLAHVCHRAPGLTAAPARPTSRSLP